MLNPKAMSAAGGAGDAIYLWREAVGITEDLVAEQILLERRAAYDDAVQGLILALDAVGEKQYRQTVEGLLGNPDPETFTRITVTMSASFHGMGQIEWADAVDRIVEARNAPLSYSELSREVDRRMAELTSNVEYRKDTSKRLAAALKIDLTAPPRLQELKRLLSAKAADGEQIEGRYYQPPNVRQTIGYLSLIFSADKSVSTVYGLASPEERKAITMMQSRAVDTAMRAIAGQVGRIRSRRDGIDKRDPADVTWVQWQHHMSRRGDPQLHTHVSLLNIVRSRVDGKVGTLDTFLLHGFYPKVREIYHKSLATELDKLGLSVKYEPRVPAAVITGIPDIVLRHFSGRHTDAEAWLKAGSINFPTLTDRERKQWLTYASAQTRQPKKMHAVPGNVHSAWHARAAGQGYVAPSHFIHPHYLQPALTIAPETQKIDPRQQTRLGRPQLDSRYNRGGGHYEEDNAQRHGMRR